MNAFMQDFMTDDNHMCRLTDIQFFEEGGEYFFNVKYQYEDDKSVREINIPKLRIPIAKDRVVIGKDNYWSKYNTADIGFGRQLMCETRVNSTICGAYIERIIEEKPKEMTIAEIEKKLGHRIKIVLEEK